MDSARSLEEVAGPNSTSQRGHIALLAAPDPYEDSVLAKTPLSSEEEEASGDHWLLYGAEFWRSRWRRSAEGAIILWMAAMLAVALATNVAVGGGFQCARATMKNAGTHPVAPGRRQRGCGGHATEASAELFPRSSSALSKQLVLRTQAAFLFVCLYAVAACTGMVPVH